VAEVSLRVAGKDYRGWKSVRVTRSIEAVSGRFDLAVADAGLELPIEEGAACTVLVGTTPIITGYVETLDLSFDPESHDVSVSGRDRTGDLVDCSAVLGQWEFRGVPLLTYVQRLAEPFGIAVSLQPGLILTDPPPPKFTIDPGDTIFEALDKACRMAGVLPISDGLGGLVLTRVGVGERVATALVEGQNILRGSASRDVTGRYGRYIVSAQKAGTDESWGSDAAAVKGEATDETVRPARVLLIRPESSASASYAKRRAQWEAKVRAARSEPVQLTVQGWTQGRPGTPWPVNALVQVRSPTLRINGEMLITEVTYSLDDGGTTTELQLRRPDAFLPEPVVTKASAARWKELG
jgi:prophage tail gpP-like protein